MLDSSWEFKRYGAWERGIHTDTYQTWHTHWHVPNQQKCNKWPPLFHRKNKIKTNKQKWDFLLICSSHHRCPSSHKTSTQPRNRIQSFRRGRNPRHMVWLGKSNAIDRKGFTNCVLYVEIHPPSASVFKQIHLGFNFFFFFQFSNYPKSN